MKPGAGFYFFAVFLLVFLLLPFQEAKAENSMEKDMVHDHNHEAHQQSAPLKLAPQNIDQKEWVKEQTGKHIPLDASFKNERGETVTLQQLIDRPTLLLPVYYYCPKTCSFDMANLALALSKSSHPIETFRVISMSFSEIEPPAAAATAKPNYIELLGEDFPNEAWTFLTGDKDNIIKVTQAIGYTFKKQPDQTFIHPSAMVALAEDGKIIKYVYGSFIVGDVDLAIAEAAKGTPANSIRRFLSFCFNYSPKQNQTIFRILKFGTVALVTIGGIFFLKFLFKKRE